jgi:ferrochelatase
MGKAAPRVAVAIEPYYDHPGFIAASAAMIRQAVRDWEPERLAAAGLILTAHAIPIPAEDRSPYRSQVMRSARLIAAAAGHPQHEVAFQSAPSHSVLPWSRPSVAEVLQQYRERGIAEVLVQAIGFLVDHAEVLYDLDVECAGRCAELGLGYTRAHCVHDDERFIAALADRVIATDSRLRE